MPGAGLSGARFGDPGFYFTVHWGRGEAWARYVGSLKERIALYADGGDTVRADHVFWILGAAFLRLHYRMRRTSPMPEARPSTGER